MSSERPGSETNLSTDGRRDGLVKDAFSSRETWCRRSNISFGIVVSQNG